MTFFDIVWIVVDCVRKFFRDWNDTIYVTIAGLIILFGGAAVFWALEKDAQREFHGGDFDYEDSLYFITATATTVGFGDIYPLTTRGKIWIVFYILFSVTVFTFLLGTITTRVVNNVDRVLTGTLSSILRKSILQHRVEKDTDFIIEDAQPEQPTNIMKLKRYGRLLKALMVTKRRYFVAAGLYFVLMIGGAALFDAIEGFGFGNSFYFCVIITTTIGYGDFSPDTHGGKALFIIYSLIGVGMIGFVIGEVANQLAARIQGVYEEKLKESVVDLPEIQDQVFMAKKEKKQKDITEFAGSISEFYENLGTHEEQQFFMNRLEQFMDSIKTN